MNLPEEIKPTAETVLIIVGEKGFSQTTRDAFEQYAPKISEGHWPKSWLQFLLYFPLAKMKRTVAKLRLPATTLKRIRNRVREKPSSQTVSD